MITDFVLRLRRISHTTAAMNATPEPSDVVAKAHNIGQRNKEDYLL